ncbi:phospholipase A1-like [Aethina tumida]|uniref:phospholipase A1-like n=1 Tax=Aethina tumida TaxID=116153 RepID=UPI00096B23B8|nr:phospholipase A1-like [Aethina tumida]
MLWVLLLGLITGNFVSKTVGLVNNQEDESLHENRINSTRKECIYRPPETNRDHCPDPDVKYILYNDGKRQVIDYTQTDWLRQSIWDPLKEDIMIVHGYAGGDDTLPIVVLRDAYIQNGSYNVWMVDWGALCEPPCYRAGVNNLRAVARCTGELLSSLRTAGLSTNKLSCVGHSLGAHICGMISRYVTFRLHRIIGLDPARPLVTPDLKLNSGDANAVHVLHTNAGHYGERDRGGHVDFCINGGRVQPFCESSDLDEQLCSHVWSICYMAESIHPGRARRAEPCSRRCPSGPRPGIRVGHPIMMGQYTPLYASGSYCVHDGDYPPYCPKFVGDIGDKRCCLKSPDIHPPNYDDL